MNIDDLLDGPPKAAPAPAAEEPGPDTGPAEAECEGEGSRRKRSSYAPPRERVGRPTTEEVETQLRAAMSKLTQKDITRAAAGAGTAPDWADFLQPVTINWLAKVFRMDPQTVKKRLVKCPALGNAGNGRPIYDFVQAAGFLVPPKMDMDEYIKSLDPAKLPNHINKAFWEAKRIRLKYLLEAKEAWHSADVHEVFGDVFLTLKNVIQLWPDTVKENTNCDDDQYFRLREMSDALQTTLYEKLIKLPQERQTLSIAAERQGGEVSPGDASDEEIDELLE